jgi:RNA polymerase sigma-70 factor (ECF subfamily)
MSIVGNQEDAREVVQEVFLKVWELGTAWQPTRSLKLYLYRAVRNQSLNHKRRDWSHHHVRQLHQSAEAEQVVTPESDALEDVHQKELAAAIQTAIDELPERRRITYLLHRRHGLTYAEIAEIMHVSPKTVGNQLTEALKYLRERLTPFYR